MDHVLGVRTRITFLSVRFGVRTYITVLNDHMLGSRPSGLVLGLPPRPHQEALGARRRFVTWDAPRGPSGINNL